LKKDEIVEERGKGVILPDPTELEKMMQFLHTYKMEN